MPAKNRKERRANERRIAAAQRALADKLLAEQRAKMQKELALSRRGSPMKSSVTILEEATLIYHRPWEALPETPTHHVRPTRVTKARLTELADHFRRD